MSYNPLRAQILGNVYVGSGQASLVTTRALTSTQNYLAWGFTSPYTANVNSLRFYLTAKAGTGGTLDAAIRSTVAGSDISASSTFSTLTTSTWIDVTGLSAAVTAGNQYYAIIRNTDALPATNNITLNVVNSQSANLQYFDLLSWGMQTSADGTTWTAPFGNGFWLGLRIGFDNGSYIGVPIQSSVIPASAVAGNRIYSTNQVGAYFTNDIAKPNVIGAVFAISHVGTPTGNFSYKLYEGSSATPGAAVATTVGAISKTTWGSPSNGRLMPLYFSSPYTLASSTTYRIMVAESAQADASSNAWGVMVNVWDSDASSLALKPFNGTWKKTVTTDGTTFSETSTDEVCCGLLLSDNTIFTSAAGGGVITHPGMTGGIHG